jgi:acetyl-CoA carboxylase biotin carboxylase subunit
MPSPGTITSLHLPGGNGVRMDTAVYAGYAIPPYYDSMIVKVIVHDRDRKSAIQKMISTLGELVIEGVKTNLDFQYELLNQPDFQEGKITTDFIAEHYPQL